MIRALVLLSGGLDSMLAVKVLQAQGIEVAGVCFTGNFFNCVKARAAADQLGIGLKIVDISDDILSLVKKPPSGYGKNMNPCIDCHSLMIRKAAEFLEPPCQRGMPERYDFIATGEVLGQRPFSQNKSALEKVAKLAGTEVLRPLSAQLLPETEIEKNGIVERDRLLSLNGRNHAEQLALIRKYKITEFPMPAGGCLLTDPEFSARLAEMIRYWPECGHNDIELLKNGRVLWFDMFSGDRFAKNLLVIGRNEAENYKLAGLAKKGDFMVELINETGPVSLLRAYGGNAVFSAEITTISIPVSLKSDEIIIGKPVDINETSKIIKLLTAYYSPKLRGKSVEIRIKVI